jgi:hypothetical protein
MAAPVFDNVSSFQVTGQPGITIPAFLVSGSDRAIFVGQGASDPTASQTSSVVRNAPSAENFTEVWDEIRSTTHRCSGHVFIAPVTGSYSITLTYAGSLDESEAGATSFTDVHQTTPHSAFVSAQSGSGTATVDAISGDAANELIIDHVYVFTTALTVGAGQTSRFEEESIGAFGSGGTSTQPATSGTTMSWSHTSAAYIIGAITLRSTAWVEPTGIRYVGGMSDGFVGRTTALSVNFALTGGIAALPEEDDLVIVAYCVGSTVDRTLAIDDPGGTPYTLIGTELTQSDTFDVNLRVAYKFMGPTPDTAVVFGQTGNAQDGASYQIRVYRNVDPTTPLDVAAVSAVGASSRVANPPAITPTTAGAWVVAFGAAACGTGGLYTSSDLSNFLSDTQSDTNDAMSGAGDFEWTSGAFDPAAFGGGGTTTTSDSWAAMTIALRPVATGSNFSTTLTEAVTLAANAEKRHSMTRAEAVALVANATKSTAKAPFVETLSLVQDFDALLGKVFVESVALVDTLRKSGSITRSEALLLVANASKHVGKVPFAEAVALVQQFAKTPQKSLSEVVVLAATLSPIIGKNLAETLSLVASIDKRTARSLVETVQLVDVIAKLAARELREVVTLSDVFGAFKVVLKTLTESVALVDIVSRSASRSLQDQLALVDTAAKFTIRSLSDSLALTNVVTRSVSRQLAENVTLAGTLTTAQVLVKTLTEVIAVAGTITRQAGKQLGESIVLSDGRQITLRRDLRDALAVDALAHKLTDLHALIETVNLQGNALKTPGKTAAEQLALSDALGRSIAALRTETLTLSIEVARALDRMLVESVTLVDAVVNDQSGGREGEPLFAAEKLPMMRTGTKEQLGASRSKFPFKRAMTKERSS